METCPKCKGKKKIIVPAEKSPLNIAFEAECDGCKGMGTVGDPQACKTCNGSKKTVRPLTLSNGGNIGIEVNCPDC